MTLPPLEPRSHTLDALDACTRRLDHAREAVLSEVAYLGGEIDRLRAGAALVSRLSFAERIERGEHLPKGKKP